ncbi:hypothetical protein ACTNCI_09630 [Mitsuokella jalaludinii]|uniref:hypothetical protein n=1 Tax=Mitsuokella jalaludinii TaxID=187979 RepID=UPI003F8A3574
MSRFIEYRFKGYTAYEESRQKIGHLCAHILTREHARRFLMAVNEAVCNACRYAGSGVDETPVAISILLTESELRAVIRGSRFEGTLSPTEIQKRMRHLIQHAANANKDWGEYVRDSERGTGFWFMLQAVDYLILDADDGSVTLSTHRQMLPPNRKIRYLVPKFFVRKGGVIS